MTLGGLKRWRHIRFIPLLHEPEPTAVANPAVAAPATCEPVDGRLKVPEGVTPTPDRSARQDPAGREYVVDDVHADAMEAFIDLRDAGDPRRYGKRYWRAG
jgi:hypothetical protein